MLLSELNRVKRISSNSTEIKKDQKHFRKAGYPPWFGDKTINEFMNLKEDETIIPTQWFDEQKKHILIRLPYCRQNEI